MGNIQINRQNRRTKRLSGCGVYGLNFKLDGSNMTKKIVNADTEGGQLAGEAIVEVIENQLRDNEPPETKVTLDRLMAMGESRENAIRYIASALSVEIFEALKNSTSYNEERYIKNLKALPELPYE